MNIFEAYNSTKKALENAGIEDYVFEAKQIIKHITGFSNSEILMNYTNSLTEFQSNNLTAIIKQRELRYPLQYIFGEWAFYGRDYYVGPGVLVPRADTEILAEECIKVLKDKEKPEALDLCAGSGCIGITIAKEVPSSFVIMLEKFSEAARYAERNRERHEACNTKLVTGDVLRGDLSNKSFDLIVSNPPYINEEEMNIISPETRYEPETALLSPGDGLDFYRAIIENYKNSIKKDGMLAFEVGIGKAQAVKKLLDGAGFKKTDIKKDLNGVDRAVYGFKE